MLACNNDNHAVIFVLAWRIEDGFESMLWYCGDATICELIIDEFHFGDVALQFSFILLCPICCFLLELFKNEIHTGWYFQENSRLQAAN